MRKKYLLHLAATTLIISAIGTSCKKPVHSYNPTPNNVRLQSYTKITSIQLSSSNLPPSTINENYRFYYDAGNRLNRIIFTSNDSFNIHKSIDFTYSHDTVFKTTVNVLTKDTTEIDTLVYNSQGQLTSAFTPALTSEYQYFGKLLATFTKTARNDSGTSISAASTYTSDNGDFLAHLYDGNLKVTLPSGRKAPFRIHWFPYLTTINNIVFYSGTPVPHHTTGYTDVYTNYNESPVYFTSEDTTGAKDSLLYPGSLWRKETYHFYTEQANRPGDYLQLQSFTMYGYNVYQNSHLVESISSQNRHANISYKFDAYNNITQTSVVVVDSVLNKYTYTYDLQYETN